jgi:hypothetical protein
MPVKICLFNGLREAVAARAPIALGANCRNVGAFAGRRVPDEEVDGRDIRLRVSQHLLKSQRSWMT